jgi:serine/threonine protein kinase
MKGVFAGKYILRKLIGEGASGKVYAASMVSSQEEVAVKILDPSLARDPRFIERFKREAETLKKFNHPGAPKLLDFGVGDSGEHYLVMEFSRGRNLKTVLDEERKFAPAKALRVTMEILAVLDAAHSLGIVHRDLKPDNVMLFPNDQIQLLDFGVAKLKERQSSGITMEGAAVGTPFYMSPEQASGNRDIDHRSDLYSVGAILFQMLVGAVPFDGKSMMHTLLMILTHPIPPLPFDAPRSLSEVLNKALAKDRDARFPDAESFLKGCEIALRDVISGKTEAKKEIEETFTLPEKTKPRILCLDDQEMIINIMKHLLEHEGYEVITSTSWEVIHSFLFTNAVDLLISDVEMPGMSGTAICKLLKKTMPELKIVLFSNLPERELEQLAEESDADMWISKNWSPPKWLEIIKGMINEN